MTGIAIDGRAFFEALRNKDRYGPNGRTTARHLLYSVATGLYLEDDKLNAEICDRLISYGFDTQKNQPIFLKFCEDEFQLDALVRINVPVHVYMYRHAPLPLEAFFGTGTHAKPWLNLLYCIYSKDTGKYVRLGHDTQEEQSILYHCDLDLIEKISTGFYITR